MNAKNFCLAGVLWTVIFFIVVVLCGCQTPYSGTLGPKDFNGWVESEEDGFVCLWNGFDRICIYSIAGPRGKDGVDGVDGKDGRDGKDGQTFIAVHEKRIEIVVERIIREVIEVPTIEYRDQIIIQYRDRIVERVVTEFRDREVPIKVFVNRVVEITKEVIVEKEVIKEVPVDRVVEVIKEVIVEVEVEVIKEVPVEVEVIKTVYVEVPAEPEQISVTEGAVYTEADYGNPPEEFHAHEFEHTHDGATHTHQVVHPDGQKDDFEREHDGHDSLDHDN
jgi:hypothetical protein